MKLSRETIKELKVVVAVSIIALMAFLNICATTATFDITATGEYIAITDNVTTIAFGTHAASYTSNTSTTHVGITNPSTVQTDITGNVQNGDWTSGGTGWTHNNADTPGANTAAMNMQRGGTWGDSVIAVQQAAPGGTPQYIYENCPATTNFDFGVSLKYPTSFTDGSENSNTFTTTAAAG